MAKYSVQLPLTGYLIVEVDADDAEAAIELALDGDFKSTDIETWQVHKHITQGNVCYAECNDANAEMISET